MGNKHPFYKINEEKETNSTFKNQENTITSSNIRDRKKPTPLHGYFYVNGMIFLDTKTVKINFLLGQPLTPR